MEMLEFITATEAEARSEAAVAHVGSPLRTATCVKCGATYATGAPAAAPAAAPSAGGLGSAAIICAAADVPPGTAGRAAALGV